ncbi:MAG: ferritin-like domain-containing protein [Gemmatimonadota bacterium]|nr:ferritin-like domain-containing protein [Gemmatimonadota bacterium]
MKKHTHLPLRIADVRALHALPSRREFLRLVAMGGTLILSGGLISACEDSSNTAGLTGPGTGATLTIDFSKGDVALLQFLFVLEQLEAEFYSRVVARLDSSDFTSADKLVLTDIANHEAIHRDVLATILGADATSRITPFFGAAGFTLRANVLATARNFEDLGVSAYLGVASYFTDAANLSFAQKIASVESRHSAAIRDLISPLTSTFSPQPFDGALSPTSVATEIQPLIEDKLAFANAPAAFMVLPASTSARSVAPSDVLQALQLMLIIAQLQADLYQRGASTTGLIPAADALVFSTLAAQESAHLAELQSLIGLRGGTPAARPSFDFTAKGNLPGFVFSAAQYATFTLLAQALEDFGVRAWKGQFQALFEDKSALGTSVSLHSVQARHASEIRRLRGKKGWITGNNRDDLPAFMQIVYDGEDNTAQGTANAGSIAGGFGGTSSATEAFDEALTSAQANAFLALFLP